MLGRSNELVFCRFLSILLGKVLGFHLASDQDFWLFVVNL